jgi:hypothetical protein
MSISPVSSTNPIQGSQNVQNQTPPKTKQTNSQPTDTVQLSQAALAHLQSSGDKDHDGDSH